MTNLLSDNPSAKIHQWQWFSCGGTFSKNICTKKKYLTLTIQSSKILQGDLAVSPDRGDDGVHLLALEAAVGDAKELVLDNKGEGSLVHVDNNCKETRLIVRFGEPSL